MTATELAATPGPPVCMFCGGRIEVYADGRMVIMHNLPCPHWEAARQRNRTMAEAAQERQNAIDFPQGEVNHGDT